MNFYIQFARCQQGQSDALALRRKRKDVSAEALAKAGQGLLKLQRALSLLGSNLASVGVLRPAAVNATGSLELGIDLGMMRYVPSVN